MTCCPECVQGMHWNCTGWTINAADEEDDCACAVAEHEGEA